MEILVIRGNFLFNQNYLANIVFSIDSIWQNFCVAAVVAVVVVAVVVAAAAVDVAAVDKGSDFAIVGPSSDGPVTDLILIEAVEAIDARSFVHHLVGCSGASLGLVVGSVAHIDWPS